MDKEKNILTCKKIAETFELITEGNMYRCPHCGEWIEDTRELIQDPKHPAFTTWEVDENHDEDGRMKCPKCGEWVQFEDYNEDDYAEEVSIFDYIEDNYGIDVTRQGIETDAPIKSVSVCVACGGPNIYIDTKERAVCLYWWSDRAEYQLTTDACNALEDAIEELAAA